MHAGVLVESLELDLVSEAGRGVNLGRWLVDERLADRVVAPPLIPSRGCPSRRRSGKFSFEGAPK